MYVTFSYPLTNLANEWMSYDLWVMAKVQHVFTKSGITIYPHINSSFIFYEICLHFTTLWIRLVYAIVSEITIRYSTPLLMGARDQIKTLFCEC